MAISQTHISFLSKTHNIWVLVRSPKSLNTSESLSNSSFSGLFFKALLTASLCIILQSLNPVINPNYYNYYIQTSNLKEKFPNKIPNNAENIKFIHSIGIFQGGTIYSLYYIDNKMTDEIFMKKYKNKAIWIGHIDEYTDKKGLLSGVFNDTPAHDKNTNDYTIYLMDGDCDNSGYCNHGNYIIAAFNKKTYEVIFSSEQW